MAVGCQSLDAGLPYVERKGTQPLNGVHEKDAAVPMADLADGGQVGAIAAQELHETDGQKACAAAGFFDTVERIEVGKPFDAHAGLLQFLPGEVVGGKLVAE